MTRARAALLIGAACATVTLHACAKRPLGGGGTIELDEVDVASLVGGRLVRLTAQEGDSVRAGDTLAVLDRGEISAELASQLAQAQSADARARDLASGARPAEVLAARAERLAAEAELKYAESELARGQRLAQQQVLSASELDRLTATRDGARARANAARERERLQEDGFRRNQVKAAKSTATAAAAQLAGARSRASELVLVAPRDGVVLLKNFEVGEIVPANTPVVTLGDPRHLWIRVYVAAPMLPQVRLGAHVDVTPIGSKRAYPGRVVEIATRAEFTPRAALTEEEQANLVFGVKVALDPGDGSLKPGLPADARITASAP